MLSASVWFVIAGLTALAGGVLLALDRNRYTGNQRERRRWAALRGWRFVLSDPALAARWCHGAIALSGAGLAKDLVIGSLFTTLGRRVVQVFDHEHDGAVSSVIVAVQRRAHAADLVVELWLPDQVPPPDSGLALLGTLGERVALVNDRDQARPLVADEFVLALSALGDDIPVTWLEQDWVLAAAPDDATPARLERLLRVLDEIAEALDAAGVDHSPALADFSPYQ